MENIKELRKELIELFNSVKLGDIKKGDAKEMANAAGKLMTSIKLELDYAKLIDKKPIIDFLEYEDKKFHDDGKV